MKFILITILLFSITSCSEEAKKQPRQNEITKVSFGYGSSWSGAVFQIEVDSSLQYKLFREPNDFLIGRISQDIWDTLNIRFGGINYSELDTSESDVVDGSESGLIVFRNGHRHSGYSSFEQFPIGIQDAINWLIATHERVALKGTSDSLSFEYPIVTPPPAPPISPYKTE